MGNTANDWLLCCGLNDIVTQTAKQIDINIDLANLQHNYRAEFIVSGNNVLQAAKVFHSQFKDIWIPALEVQDKVLIGHAMERLWMEIFRQARLRSLSF